MEKSEKNREITSEPKTTFDKVKTTSWVIARIVFMLASLYFFICSLSFLTSASLILLGKDGAKFFADANFLGNQFVGLMIGVLATVVFQSSSTTTSIVVTLVGAGVLDVGQAVPMVMGANIGTSVTNTFVSMGQIADRASFERAFAAATVHDMFNWLTVAVLLPVEIVFGYLEKLTGAIVDGMHISEKDDIEIMEKLTKPFTNLVIQIDKKVFAGWSANDSYYLDNFDTLLKAECNESHIEDGSEVWEMKQCGYLFADTALSDVVVGVLMLIIALVMLVGCLGVLVKVLNSLMKEKLVELVKTKLNGDLPYVPWLTGYIALCVGAVVTFVIQSSSVFTSTLTPLVGTGVFTLDRAYILTLGSNIGTCGTSMLAALTVSGEQLKYSLQIALCHLFFNVTGIILFYPIPFMRWPIPMAKALGRTVAKYRWFSVFYLLVMFILIPGYVMALSFADSVNYLGVYIGFVPLVILLILVLIVNVLQDKYPKALPEQMRSWDYLPMWMRSFEPMDRVVSKVSWFNKNNGPDDDEVKLGTGTPSESSVSIDIDSDENYQKKMRSLAS